MKAIKLAADKLRPQLIDIDYSPDTWIQTMREVCNTKWIERIIPWRLREESGQPYVLVCDENPMLKEDVKENLLASMCVGQEPFYGDMLIIKDVATEQGPDWLPVPEEEIDGLMWRLNGYADILMLALKGAGK